MRYALGVIAIIFLTIIGIVLFVGRDSGDDNTKSQANIRTIDYAEKDGVAVSWTQQGELVGDNEYRAIRITITPEERKLEVLAGYNERVIRTVREKNSPDAYDDFLKAIDIANFSLDRKVAQTDESGVCPFGNRFIYELRAEGNQVSRTWSDTCSRRDGTSAGEASDIEQLFQAQITDYSEATEGVQL